MPGKSKIIVSDLHLGAGFEAEGNLLEDFGSDQEFGIFLDSMAAESDREGLAMELIVNGDAFEMLQVPNLDSFDPATTYRPEQYHSSSESDSARKMSLIIDGHTAFFQAIGRFLRVGGPRRTATFVKGNHDLNLHWESVQGHIRQATRATGGRSSLLSFEEVHVSREGIYVEHGNQYADFVNRVDDMEEPHDPDGPGQLALPLGSWFVMDVFNQVEREKYWIDGVKPITALVWYALVYDFPFAARSLAAIIRALPGIVEEGILLANDPRTDLLRQLEDPTRVEEIGDRYANDPAFRAWFNAEVSRLLPPPEPASAALITQGSPPQAFCLGDQVRAAVRSSLYEAASKRAREEGARVVVFGHTHDRGVEGLADGAQYINSGTWTWRADFGAAGKETWRDLFEHPERFTGDRRLSYVRIDYGEADEPVGQLLEHQPLQRRPAPLLPSLWRRFWNWFRILKERLSRGDE